MDKIEHLIKEIDEIKARNKKVEWDKAWETSFARKIVVAVLTYIVIVLFFIISDLPKPFLNPIVPTIWFVLSTMSVPIFKNLRLSYFYKKSK